MSTTKRIGLIGLSAKGSWASKSHLPYLQKSPHYKITALQNSSKASAQAAVETYKLDSTVSTYDNPKALAADANVDIVAVSVNVPEHYALIKPALEAGKDVFVEWPLARNLADAEELTQLAKSKGVRTMVGLQARQSPPIVKAKEIVESGKLGQILGTTMYGHGIIFGPTIHASFLYGMDVENGANLLTIPFGHAVDALCFVLGEISSLNATLANNRPELPLMDHDGKEIRKVSKTAHDYVSITGNLVKGGVVDVTYVGGMSRTGRDFYWEITGTEGSLVFEGPQGGGHVQMHQPTLKYVGNEPEAKLEVVEVEQPDGTEQTTYLHKANHAFNVGKAWDSWAGAGQSVTAFEDALVRHRMIDAFYRSAKEGTRESYL
ncbi:NAD-binding Rossmann fold oxidoreductase family protein [Lophiostoma macrostomum CBS 122681]|uniref:NAD-binding Rossmann fold oxidoreductase family protein n=1 Tax=Lophiostoma macrostomum CBS 122681 TaxID=1314788 RepID=A0A6A6SSW5_9PLEO|nr:NAD-binding Rossmann fold oxidoreductase family protein [Lophiostoma macrostomum CBS 122681]